MGAATVHTAWPASSQGLEEEGVHCVGLTVTWVVGHQRGTSVMSGDPKAIDHR